MSLADAAAYKNVTERTIRYWIDRGIIGATRDGLRKIKVSKADLDALRFPIVPSQYLTDSDRELARKTAEALLPLTEGQRERLSLLLHPGGRSGSR